MTQAKDDPTNDAAQFAEMLGQLWGLVTLTSRARGGLPVLPPSQAHALRLVISNEKVTPTELATDMRLSRPMVSELIRKLEENKLVTRRRSQEDGRSVILAATERGRYVQQHFRLGLVDAMAEAFGALPDGEVELILSTLPVLSKLHAQLEVIAAREEAAARRPARRRSGTERADT